MGLFAPPLLASAAVGAAAGGVIGAFVDHRMKTELHDKIGENIPAGTAGIIAIFDTDQRLAVEQCLSGAPLKSVAQSEKSGARAQQDWLAEAMGKFVPDRSHLPIPARAFGGVAGHTLDTAEPDWSMIPGPKAPDGAPNVLLVLIDDAGFGAPSSFGGPVATPNFERVKQAGVTYNRFHVTALCSPTRAALLTRMKPASCRVRIDRRVPRTVPGILDLGAQVVRAAPPRAQGERLRDGRVRQVAPDARQRAGRSRTVRALAAGMGL